MCTRQGVMPCLGWSTLYRGQIHSTSYKYWKTTVLKGTYTLLTEVVQQNWCRYVLYRAWGRVGTSFGGNKCEVRNKTDRLKWSTCILSRVMADQSRRPLHNLNHCMLRRPVTSGALLLMNLSNTLRNSIPWKLIMDK